MFRMQISKPWIIVFLICILGFAFSILLSGIYFHFLPFDSDTVSYLFQAKLFAQGKLYAPAPPEFGFSPSRHINIYNGKWYSKYPFGNSLVLTLGVLLGAPCFVPAVLPAFSLLLLYLLVKESYNGRIALLAVILGLISPATLVIGSTWLSEGTSRFFAVLFVFALFRTLKRGGWFYPVLVGFAIGYVFCTRPIVGLTFGLASSCFVLYWQIRERRLLLKATTYFLIPFSIMISLCLAWNYYFTGSPIQSTWQVLQTYSGMGFGKRMEGYTPDLNLADCFTPKYSFQRLWRHVLPCISVNTFGWGRYEPSYFRQQPRFLRSVETGIIAKSPADEDWITLKFAGSGDGKGKIKFQMRERETGNGLTGDAPGFSCSGGKSELEMRLLKHKDEYTGYFRTSLSKDWIQVGPARLNLTAPLELGIYGGVNFYSGVMDIYFDYIKVNGQDSEDFDNGISSNFMWQREPDCWDVNKTKPGWLHFKAGSRSDLWKKDIMSKLYCMTDREDFDIETRLIAGWRNSRSIPVLRVIPLVFPFILMLIPFFSRSRNRYDFLFLSFFIITLCIYFFHYFDGSVFGHTAASARYYVESIFLGIIPLSARGIFLLLRWLKSLGARLGKSTMRVGKVLLVLVMFLLLTNTVYTYILQKGPLQNWNSAIQKLPLLVKEYDIHRAVVFVVRRYEGVPVGDYPFENLKEADVVYFRLGPDEVWGLISGDLKAVWKQYFRDRTPYLYRGDKLRWLTEEELCI